MFENVKKQNPKKKSLKSYKIDLTFQDTFPHVKYYKHEAGIKPPKIFIDDDDWNEAHDTDVWIGLKKDEDTNEIIEKILDLKYVHDILPAKTINHCMNKPNEFTALAKQTIKYLKKKCNLWRGNVTIFYIMRTILTPADPTTKSEEISDYSGYDHNGNKYILTLAWIQSMYKGLFPELFKKITQGPPDKKIAITDKFADTTINQNIHDTNASFESFKSSYHTLIPIEYRQHKYQACGFYSLASVLHHIQDEELGKTVQSCYHNKYQLKHTTSQICQCAQIVQNKGKKWVAMNIKKRQ